MEVWQQSEMKRSNIHSWCQTNRLNLFSWEELVGWGKLLVCHHSSSFTSDKHKELLILNWPTSWKLHASEMKWLLAYLTFIWAQAANVAEIVHWCIPKRDRAPCAAKTETEGLASPKLPSGGLRLSQGCLAPWVSSPEVLQKKLLGELTYPFLFLLYHCCTVFPLCSLSAFKEAHPLCVYVLVWRVAAKTIV